MEDAATAEISRTQIWQWIRHGARLDDGRAVSARLFQHVLDEETGRFKPVADLAGRPSGRLAAARDLFARLATAETCADFLTIPAYELLLTSEQSEEALHAAHRHPTR
jgi:malate synthase